MTTPLKPSETATATPFYEGTHGEYDPDLIDLIRELRDVLGLFSGAMPRSPADVWHETLRHVQELMRRAGEPCVFGPRCHCRLDVATYHYSVASMADQGDPR